MATHEEGHDVIIERINQKTNELNELLLLYKMLYDETIYGNTNKISKLKEDIKNRLDRIL